MKESSHKDNFEEYLRKQANEHRMYPSDYVWTNIRKKIHTPKKWPALSVFTVLIISALVIGTVLNKPVPDTVTANFHFSLQSPVNALPEKNIVSPDNKEANVPDEHYSAEQLTSNTIIAAVEKIKIDDAVAKQLLQPFFNDVAIVQNNSLPVKEITPDITKINEAVAAKPRLINNTSVLNSSSALNNINYYLFDVTSRLKSILNTNPSPVKSGGFAFFKSKNNDFNYTNIDLRVTPEHTELFPNALEQLGKNSNRFDFRFYVTPSISYRHLDEKRESKKAANTSLESSYKVNPSQAIHQAPSTGYETGIGLGYHLNNKFTLTGGFQFNISQYKIDAFSYKDEQVAVILNDGKFSNTINTVSGLRSVAGTKPLTLQNRYYELSMPVGLEWMILNTGNFSWSLAGALQPTYTFDKQPFIISSNYKNYTDGSAYIRNLNLNTNLETYFGYTRGSYRWQIGPQLRYQMLSSLVDKYPNKEYLINYGLKVGVVKQLH